MLDKMLDSMIVNGSYNRAAWPTSLTKWAISFGAASGNRRCAPPPGHTHYESALEASFLPNNRWYSWLLRH